MNTFPSMMMEININATTAKLINAEKILNGCVKIVACISVTMARRKTASWYTTINMLTVNNNLLI